MAEQFSMFNGDSFVKPTTERLVLSRWNGGRLTKAQRTFNRLVRRVETLRGQIESRARELDRVLADYAEHLHPRLQTETALRKDLLLGFSPYLKQGMLKKKDRATLRRLMEDLLHFVVPGDRR